MSVPFFDAKQKHSIEHLATHDLQKYMALFLSKPELYVSIHRMHMKDKQDYFFEQFRKFLIKYYMLKESEFDLSNYFNSLSIAAAGSVNIAGGGGSRSNSGRKAMIDRFNATQTQTKMTVEYFRKKYGIAVGGYDDQRVFLGHTMPWMNASPELLDKEDWHWVKSREYSDETLSAPFPETLDAQLVPLKIRNKVVQAHKKQKQISVKLEPSFAAECDACDVPETNETSEIANQKCSQVEDKLAELQSELFDIEW